MTAPPRRVAAALSVAVLLLVGTAQGAASQSVGPKVRWDAPLPSPTLVASRTDAVIAGVLATLDPQSRRVIQRDLDALAKSARGVSDEHVRAATYLVAGYDGLALLYAADAVRRDPLNAVSVGNYGALLYARDGAAGSVETLRYAMELAPRAVTIAITLGNAALSVNELERARQYFERALRVNGESGEALLGMGIYWMHKGDPKAAWGYFAQGSGVTYSRKAEQVPAPVDGDHDPLPPPRLIESAAPPPTGGAGESDGGSAHVTGVKIEFAPSPDWSSPDAFVAAAQGRRAYAAWFTARRKEAFERVKTSAGRSGASYAPAALPPGSMPVAQMSSRHARVLNDQWLTGNFKKALNKFNEAVAPGLKQLGAAQTFVPTAPLPTDVPAAHAAFAASVRKSCLDAHALLTGTWQIIKPAQAQLFDDVDDLLQKYYRAQGGLIRTIDDRDEYDTAVATRDMVVLSMYSALLTQEDALRIAVALQIAAGGTGSSTQCPDQAPPGAPEVPADSKKPELAPPPRVPCPFEKHPVDLSTSQEFGGVEMGASFKLDCKSVSGGISAGAGGATLSASRTRIFKRQTVTEFVSEVSGSQGVSGMAEATLKMNAAIKIVREEDGREVATTRIGIEGNAQVKGIAEASITGGLESTLYDTSRTHVP